MALLPTLASPYTSLEPLFPQLEIKSDTISHQETSEDFLEVAQLDPNLVPINEPGSVLGNVPPSFLCHF